MEEGEKEETVVVVGERKFNEEKSIFYIFEEENSHYIFSILIIIEINIYFHISNNRVFRYIT
jgi:hypothetical protein